MSAGEGVTLKITPLLEFTPATPEHRLGQREGRRLGSPPRQFRPPPETGAGFFSERPMGRHGRQGVIRRERKEPSHNPVLKKPSPVSGLHGRIRLQLPFPADLFGVIHDRQ